MSFSEPLTTWQGMPVQDWKPGLDLTSDICYRLGIEWEDKESWADKFAQLLSQPDVSEVTGLVVGLWADETVNLDAIVEAIVGARGKLPKLTALFIGDITYEEWEISWIHQSDLSPLLTAYPNLEHFGVRGTEGLSLGIPKLPRLKSLTIQSGGLPVSVIEEVIAAELPSLEYLELFIGVENYGGDSTVVDLQPILQQGPTKWLKLTHLGLRDCPYADELAGVLASGGGAPILRQLHTLDLSLGTLSDPGIRALVYAPATANLTKIDIHHHYATEAGVALLTALGIEVDASKAQGDVPPDSRYVAVSE